MNRRRFFANLAGIFVAASAPTIFVPKLIETRWKPVAFPVNPNLMRDVGTMQEAFAAYIGPVIQSMLDQQYSSWNLIYGTDLSFGQDDSPSFPMDLVIGSPRSREGCRIL